MSSSQPNNPASSDDDFLLMFVMIIAAMLALYFFGKDIIVAYWKVVRLLEFWILVHVDPAYLKTKMGPGVYQYLINTPISKVRWAYVRGVNHSLDQYLSIGSVQVWPIFWAILPASIALPLWNKNRNLKKTFPQPWDLARYMSRRFPWMMPVIRHRSEALKNRFKPSRKKGLLGVFRSNKNSDWPLHPLTILIQAGAFVKDEAGTWSVQDEAVARWAIKQVGAKAGRDGFSTPERNALFHALVSGTPQPILKSFAAGGDKVIRKHQKLSAKDVAKFKIYQKKHAYEVCILLSALKDARKKEIVPPNWFVWMKYKDRALWYALHGLGLPRPHPEGLPGLVQWHSELRHNGPVSVIQSQLVKSGLWDALEEIQWQKSREWLKYVNG